MASVRKDPPLSYAVMPQGRWCEFASEVDEPSPVGPPYPVSSTAPAGTLRPRHATPALVRVVHPAGTPASLAGQTRAKRRLAEYGGRLICVRYRYDAVDLLAADRDWEPRRPPFAHDQIVGSRVAFTDVAARGRVTQAIGTRNPERRAWQLRYDRVLALSLNTRIVDEPASNSGCPGSSGGNLHAGARAPSRERYSHPLSDAGTPRQVTALVSTRS